MDAAVVIPAYNEEKNIGCVLDVIKGMGEFSDILVVSDGSTDMTRFIAERYGVRTIEFLENRGKGVAMREGMRNTTAPVILFLDADLVGLTQSQVRDLVVPVLRDDADMTLGIFESGRKITDLAQRMAPFLTGQRAIKRSILESLSEDDWTAGFGIEISLTRHVMENNMRITQIPLSNATHTMKEEKFGLARGVAARLKMYWEIAKELNKY